MAFSTMATAGSPIAELERLLKEEAALAVTAPAERASRSPGWNYAVLERDRQLHSAVAEAQPPARAPAPAEVPSEVSSSVGCVVAGTTGVTLASLAGGLNTINLIGGGLVTAVNPVTFYVSMMGLVFGSFCQLGSALTPLYVYMTTPAPEPHIGPPVVVPPQREPQPKLDELPDFRHGVPYQSQKGGPMIQAAEHPLHLGPDAGAASRSACMEDRRSIRNALSALVHGAGSRSAACAGPAI